MVGQRSRKRGFQPIGSVRPGGLGLSRARERELRLAHAWRSVAGDALAEKATVKVRRGVLDVEAVDLTWRTALEPLMPQIALRLSLGFRALGLRAWRIHAAGIATPSEEHAIAAPAGQVAEAPTAREVACAPEATERLPDASREELEARLRRVAARYVERLKTRSAD